MTKEELAYLFSEFVANGHWNQFIDWATSEEMGYDERPRMTRRYSARVHP